MQRKFLVLVLTQTNCPSLRSLISRGFDLPYSTIKSYFNEYRLLPESLFLDLCIFASLDPSSFNIIRLKDNWGRVIGGQR